MKESKYPRLSIRLSPELAAACKAAGPDRVREALAVLLSDKPLSDKPTLSDKPKERELIVRQDPPEIVRQSPEAPQIVGQLSDKPGEVVGQKPVPPWRAKLDEQRDKLARAKAEKDAERAARERAGRMV